MIRRALLPVLHRSAKQYPVVTLTGPRQSGKTTLARAAFPRHRYVSLEDPDDGRFAREDPRGFLNQFAGSVILDEVQRAPDLFSYIQTMVDEREKPGRFILSGSKNFLLLEKVSQSLAGRCAILHLLPFSLSELGGRRAFPVSQLGRTLPRKGKGKGPVPDLMETLFRGFYPRIHDKGLEPRQWLRGYYQTYVQRDVRSILNVGDLEAFERFIRLCAGRNGQLLNLSALGADCGITHTTARRWTSILETSFLIHLLRPHHRNFSKRMIKSPKLYFLDTGLLCYLLGIRSPDELHNHASRGAIFESLVVSELLKNRLHQGEESDLYFWRDSTGHEIDLLLDLGSSLTPIEIKSGMTVASDFFHGLEYWRRLSGRPDTPGALVYAGDRAYRRGGFVVHPWAAL
ncbi:MAG: ATP-binding protein [Candidatus Eisenbacteria bacterium]|nr:ATP-binding protein [Candidatus Eisenbacteria bacterium]